MPNSSWVSRSLPVALLCAAPPLLLPGPFVEKAFAGVDEPAAVARGASGDVSTPLHATISIDSLVPAGRSATITCEIAGELDAPDVTARIELPPNVEAIHGDLAWEGDLLAGIPASFSAEVRFRSGGDTAIYCRVRQVLDERNSWGDLAALYLSVGSRRTRVGFAPAERVRRAVEQIPGAGILLPESKVAPVPPAARPSLPSPPAHAPIPPHAAPPTPAPEGRPVDEKPGAPLQQPAHGDSAVAQEPVDALEGTAVPTGESVNANLTVTGNWSYYDRNDQHTGASEFLVELVRGDDYGHLAWCYTDLDGNYSCGPVLNPGGAGVRTLLHSWASFGPYADVLAVVNPDWGTTNATQNSFRAQTGVVVLPDGTQDIGTWTIANGEPSERAFWIQRDLNDTWRYIFFHAGMNQSPAGTGGPTTVQWKFDSVDGTYYSWGENVHLAGVDPLSKSVARHEYSHNVMYSAFNAYFPPSPNCNPHWIPAPSSAGCAWTEGWAEYLPAAVDDDPTFYWPDGGSLDLEAPSWNTVGWGLGDIVEGRVAGALWDIHDANDDGDDTYSDGGFPNIWDVLSNVTAANFSAYWAGWLARGHSNVSWGPIMDLYQNTIDYRNGPANDDFGAAVPIGAVPFSTVGLDTAGATTQGSDPATSCGSTTYPRQSRSVWYDYTPPVTGTYSIQTVGSDFDTVLAVWYGSWGGLFSAGCDDDGGGNWTSSLGVGLFGGETYHIEVAGFGSSPGGSLALSVSLSPPPNDHVADALWAGGGYTDYENTQEATTSRDDPSFACGAYFNGTGSHSVWYRITPASNGVLTADTLTSGYDTVLSVWGGVPGNLDEVACNDDADGTLQSRLENVRLVGGMTYYIEVVGFDGVAAGALWFHLEFLPDPGRVPDSVAAGGPLLLEPGARGELLLSWGVSCTATDTDYEVYEGTLGEFSGHVPVFCSTSGATSASFIPAPGDTYYLVTPRNMFYEGSYGTDGDGVERPQGLAACAVQSIGSCSP